jgi:hypothetical protein
MGSILGLALKSKYLVLSGLFIKTTLALALVWHFNFSDQHKLTADYRRLRKALDETKIEAILEKKNIVIFSNDEDELYLLLDSNANGIRDPGEEIKPLLTLRCNLKPDSGDKDPVKIVFRPDGMINGNRIILVSGRNGHSKQVSLEP